MFNMKVFIMVETKNPNITDNLQHPMKKGPLDKTKLLSKTLTFLIKCLLAAIAIFQSCEVIAEYLSHPVVVGISLKEGVLFPSVTVCNQIPMANVENRPNLVQIPNSIKRVYHANLFYNFLEGKNITSKQEYRHLTIQYACNKTSIRSGLGDFCKNGSDLIWDGSEFVDFDGNSRKFTSVCSNQNISSFVSRHCKCGRDSWSCLDSNNTCLNFENVCDGYVNCWNGDDEKNCMGTFLVDQGYQGHVSQLWSLPTARYKLMSSNNFIDETLTRSTVILKCTFQDEPCESTNFNLGNWKAIHTSAYGICFTFSMSQQPNYSSWSCRKRSGLNLELPPFTLPSMLKFKGGYRVVLHNREEIPIPEEDGFDVPVDSSVSIMVTAKVYKRLGQPYGKCHGDYWDFNGVYSKIGCFYMCKEQQIRRTFNCYNYLSGLENITAVTESYVACSLMYGKLYYKINRDFKFNRSECHCSESCLHTVYQYKLETVTHNMQMFRDLRKLRGYSQGTFTHTGVGLSTDVGIYANSANYEYVYESPKMSFYSIVSQVGGIVGIYLGVCCLNVMNLIVDVIHRLSGKQNKISN